jgi:dihydrofolate reductase
MKLIMACSRDGYLAKSANDDMSWTEGDDKKVFKLLTMGENMGAGSNTYELMKDLNLKGRSLTKISRYNGISLEDFGSRNKTLIGGATVARVAFCRNMIDTAYICRSYKMLGPEMTDQDRLDFAIEGVGLQAKMKYVDAIKFDRVIVEVYKRKG